jgi:membrane-bound ClpP family serine protease
MISVAIGALILACASMLFLFLDFDTVGISIFGAAVVAMIVSMLFSLYETTLSNKSLLIEINDIVDKENRQ